MKLYIKKYFQLVKELQELQEQERLKKLEIYKLKKWILENKKGG